MTFEEAWESAKQVNGYLFEEEARTLYNLVQEIPDGGMVGELGSYCGRSTKLFINAIREKGGKITCVDSFVSNFDGTPLKGQEARRLFGDNILSQFSDIAKLIELDTISASLKVDDDSLDFLFIDADHSYDGVRWDCKAWLPKLKSGCIVAFHDYHDGNHPGVKNGAAQFIEGWDNVCNEFSIAAFRKP